MSHAVVIAMQSWHVCRAALTSRWWLDNSGCAKILLRCCRMWPCQLQQLRHLEGRAAHPIGTEIQQSVLAVARDVAD